MAYDPLYPPSGVNNRSNDYYQKRYHSRIPRSMETRNEFFGALPPENLTLPVIEVAGNVLSFTSEGTWNDNGETPSANTYQWYKDSVAIPGGIAATQIADTNADYYAVVTRNTTGGSTPAQSNTLSVVVPAVPTNTVPPTVAYPRPEMTINSVGTWDFSGGAEIPPKSFQWYKDNTLLGGAVGLNYTPTINGTYTADVIAKNANGSTAARSSNQIVINNAPENTVAPAIVNTDGTLSFSSEGAWNLWGEAETGRTYRWFKDSVVIGGATSNTYVATEDGNYKAEVTVTTSVGATPADSNTVSVVLVTPPVNTLPPTIINTDGTLSFSSEGTWDLGGGTEIGRTYRWFKDGVVIGGATSATYVATEAGDYKGEVTVTNEAGSTPADSNTLAVSLAPTVTGLGTASDVRDADITFTEIPEAGDLIVAFGSADGGKTLSTPDGYTQFFFADAQQRELYCFYKVSDGTETGVTIEGGLSAFVAGNAALAKNCGGLADAVGDQEGGNSSTVVVGSTTATTAGSICLICTTNDKIEGVYTEPAGYTDLGQVQGTDAAQAVFKSDAAWAAGAATGTTTITCGASRRDVWIRLMLTPTAPAVFMYKGAEFLMRKDGDEVKIGMDLWGNTSPDIYTLVSDALKSNVAEEFKQAIRNKLSSLGWEET